MRTVRVGEGPVRRRRRAPVAVLATLTLPAALFAAPAPMPVADFVRNGTFAAPLMSPDGKHLIVTQRGEKDGRDESLMVVYTLPALTIASTMRMPKGRVAAGYRWISDRRLVVSVGREYGSLNVPALTGELFAMDLDGGRYKYLYGRDGRARTSDPIESGFGSVAGVPDAMDGRLFVAEHPWHSTTSFTRLYEVDSVTASRRTVAEVRRPNFGFLLEADGTPRFAQGDEADLGHTVFRFDDASRAWEPFAVKAGEVLVPMTISSDGKELLASIAEQGGPHKLIRQNIASGERQVLAEDAIGDVGLIERGPFRSGPFAAGTKIGMPTLRYFEPSNPTAQLHRLLSAQFPGSFVHFRNFSRDGDKLLFSVASDRDPGAFYLFDRATGQASLLFAAMPWIEPERMAARRPIRFEARDGLELHGYLTLPPERGDRKLPLVLLPHGGPHGLDDEWFFDTDAQFLASRGYAVLQVNFRGSGGRGKNFEALGHRQWGGRMVDDLIDGVRWVVDQGFADADRVCGYGASYGAYAAMMSAIRTPGMFKCVIGYAGVYDLPMIYDEYDAKASTRTHNHWVKVIGRDAAELTANSPARQADQLKIPVLLVHGADDGVTPPAQAEAMRDALKKAGRPPEWFYVEDEGHGFYAAKNRQALYEKLEAFLAKHLAK